MINAENIWRNFQELLIPETWIILNSVMFSEERFQDWVIERLRLKSKTQYFMHTIAWKVELHSKNLLKKLTKVRPNQNVYCVIDNNIDNWRKTSELERMLTNQAFGSYVVVRLWAISSSTFIFTFLKFKDFVGIFKFASSFNIKGFHKHVG